MVAALIPLTTYSAYVGLLVRYSRAACGSKVEESSSQLGPSVGLGNIQCAINKTLFPKKTQKWGVTSEIRALQGSINLQTSEIH